MHNLLIIGHGRHGKDTVAEMLRDAHGYSFMSSSEFVLHEAIWEDWGKYNYDTIDECFNDRAQHRAIWARMITMYNTPDKTRTARTMLERGHNLYVGMRKRDELLACKAHGLFDAIIWVDRSEHLPEEPYTSMDLTAKDADREWYVDNNGSLDDLRVVVNMLAADLRRHL